MSVGILFFRLSFATTTSSKLSRCNTNPAISNCLLVELTDGTVSFFFIWKHYDCKAWVFTSLNVNSDVGLPNLEAFKKLNHCSFISSPWKSSNLDAAFNVFFIDTTVTTNVFVFKTKSLKLCVIFDIKIIQKDPATTNLLFLFFLVTSLCICDIFKQDCSMTSLSLGLFVHLVFKRAFDDIVTFKECINVFICGLKRQTLHS